MVVIIVPVYKEFNELNEMERISLKQLYDILGKHLICLVGPLNFNWDPYLKNAAHNNACTAVKKFKSDYFTSITGYCKLLQSTTFFKEFKEYKYLLLYQHDAYVFRDELKYWCDKGYDYIGAPWTGFKAYKNQPLLGVGNGGFSLRNVKKSLKLLNTLRLFEVLYPYRNMNSKSIMLIFAVILKKLITAHKVESKFEKEFPFYEDIFWCKGVQERLNSAGFNSFILKLIARLLVKYDFKIAPVEVASRFSIELDAKKYYELNNRVLPFGCHAWEKYEPEFWKQFIPAKAVAVPE